MKGCGDHRLSDVTFLSDPCPLPDKMKKRSLVEKEKLIYAPMSGVGGIIYDKDSIYIELGGSHSHSLKEVRVIFLVRVMVLLSSHWTV